MKKTRTKQSGKVTLYLCADGVYRAPGAAMRDYRQKLAK